MVDVQAPSLTLGLVGTGVMGRGIAQLAAQAGITVRLFDARPQAADESRASVASMFDSLVAKGRLSPETARAATARLEPVPYEASLAGCDVVVEAIVEDLRAKQELFTRLEGIVGPGCLLATNTSSLSVTAIASVCERPGRVGGFHFFNPVPLMKVVEVIEGARTEPWVGEALVALAQRLGHRPVRATDTPGFIVNHAGRGFGTEALRILQEGVASFADIDRVLREAAGFRMGPFELLDLTGLDVSHPVMESVYEQFYQEPRFRPSYVLRQRLTAGLLGRKSGQGFYSHEGGKPRVEPEPALPSGERRPVWVAADEPAWRDALLSLVRAAGWFPDDGEQPAPESLCLVAPLGRDATTTALALEVDPERTVAVDLLFSPERRRTVMTTPVTRRPFLDSALSLLAADGTSVSRIHDSTGFISQRVLATVVNIACDIAQQRIASPDDIDAAVTLGLGYPRGPLAWGDALGPRRLLKVLEAIHSASGDPRYRASPWLSRRARLGVSLLTPEN